MGFGNKIRDIFSDDSQYGSEASAPRDGSVYCTECGTRNIPGARFCMKCGRKLMIPEPAVPYAGDRETPPPAADAGCHGIQNTAGDFRCSGAGEEYYKMQREPVSFSGGPEAADSDFAGSLQEDDPFSDIIGSVEHDLREAGALPAENHTVMTGAPGGEQTDDEEMTVMVRPRIVRNLVFTDADNGKIIAKVDVDAYPVISVGRSRRRNNQVILDFDPAVSREHCSVRIDSENRVWITDSGSSNHTYVNGVPAEQPTQIYSDSIIRLGASDLRIRYEEQEL